MNIVTVSYKVGVKTAGDKDWASNGLRFETPEAAEAYAIDLAMRWTAVRDWTIIPSTNAPNR